MKNVFSVRSTVGLLVLLTLVVGLQSCQKENTVDDSSEVSSDKLSGVIINVKAKFENYLQNDRFSSYDLLGSSGKKKLNVLWDKALVYGDWVEIPFEVDGLTLIPKNSGDNSLTKRGRKRLVIKNRPQINSSDIYFVSYVPNSKFRSIIQNVNLATLKSTKFSGNVYVENFYETENQKSELLDGISTKTFTLTSIDENNNLRGDCLEWDIVCTDFWSLMWITVQQEWVPFIFAHRCETVCVKESASASESCPNGGVYPFCNPYSPVGTEPSPDGDYGNTPPGTTSPYPTGPSTRTGNYY